MMMLPCELHKHKQDLLLYAQKEEEEDISISVVALFYSSQVRRNRMDSVFLNSCLIDRKWRFEKSQQQQQQQTCNH